MSKKLKQKMTAIKSYDVTFSFSKIKHYKIPNIILKRYEEKFLKKILIVLGERTDCIFY